MDDLLKVFLVETFEGLGECDADLDRLCAQPEDGQSLGSILQFVGSIRETSSFLGLPGLHTAAASAIRVLSKIKDGASASDAPTAELIRRAIVDIKTSIVELQQSVAGADPKYEAYRRAEPPTANAAASGPGDTPPTSPKHRAKKKQTLTERFASDDAKTDTSKAESVTPVPQPMPSAPSQAATENYATTPAVGSTAIVQPDDPQAPLRSGPVDVASAGDGMVRISAETLENLLATVRQLMANQSEMMQLMKLKDEAPSPVAPTQQAIPTEPAVSASAQPAPPPVDSGHNGAQAASQATLDVTAPAAPGKVGATVDKIVPLPTRRAAAAEPVTSGIRPAPAPTPCAVKLMVFQSSSGAIRAIRAELVDHVREVDLKALDGARGLWVLRTDTRLIPLVPVDGSSRLSADGRMPAILCCIDGAWMGLLVRSIMGTVEATLVLGSSGGRHNRIATTTINEVSVDVIDPARCLSEAIDGPAQKSRAPEVPSAIGTAPSSTVVRASDLFERKPPR